MKMKSTKEQFKAFCEVRDSGETNMWCSREVKELSDGVVYKDVHIDIIKNFDSYSKLYPKIAKRK